MNVTDHFAYTVVAGAGAAGLGYQGWPVPATVYAIAGAWWALRAFLAAGSLRAGAR